MSNGHEYVLIHGLAPSGLDAISEEALRRYIAKIVYGNPSRIFGILLDSGKFVALVEYEAGSSAAEYTFARMTSFSYGSSFFADVDIAWREFGTWLAHHSGHLAGDVAAV